MKKVIKISLLLCLFTFVSKNSFTQVEQGSFLIDPYIGVPGEKILAKFNFPDPEYTYTGWPISVGLRTQYMFTDYIAVGIDVNYSSYGYEYIDEDAYYNGITQTFEDSYHEFNRNTFRLMLRANYYFIRTYRLDVYLGGGLGGKEVKEQLFIDGVQDNTVSGDNYLPFAVRGAVGGHFFITDLIGVHAEFGIYGGGFLQAGVAIKL